jgi:hypothetical protein
MTDVASQDNLRKLLYALQGVHAPHWSEQLSVLILFGVLDLASIYVLIEVTFRNHIWKVSESWQLILICIIVIAILSMLIRHCTSQSYYFSEECLIFTSPIPLLSWQLPYDDVIGLAFAFNEKTFNTIYFRYQKRKARVVHCTRSMKVILERFRGDILPFSRRPTRR